jgi:hypothetical protein
LGRRKIFERAAYALRAGGVNRFFPAGERKRSLFCRKAPQKTFETFTRDFETSPGGRLTQKFFASFFQKRSSFFFPNSIALLQTPNPDH